METTLTVLKRTGFALSVEVAHQVINVERNVNERRKERESIVKSYSQVELLRRMVAVAKDLIKDQTSFPVSNVNLALIENKVREYYKNKQVTIHDDGLARHFLAIRAFNVTKEKIPAKVFRKSAQAINRALIQRAKKEFGLNLKNDVVVIPWRSGCWPALEAQKIGFKKFIGIDVKRNENDPKKRSKVVYVTAMPKFNSDTRFFITEPMLASGGSMAKTIEYLLKKGVAPENIVSAHVIAAPEGIVRIVEAFGTRMVIGRVDECLNEDVFVAGTGIGDYGDLACEGLSAKYLTYLFRRLFTTPQIAKKFYKRASGHSLAA